MSFEGYYQVVCKNRHYKEIDYLTKELYCDEKKFKNYIVKIVAMN